MSHNAAASAGLATFTPFTSCLNGLKANFEDMGLLSKSSAEVRERLAGVQFVIDSCRTFTQSNYLNNSNKDCGWLILASLIRD